MSKINLHNYEAYFLDSIEGNLTAAEELQLKAFLEAHPDLKAELEDFESVELSKEKVQFPKSVLLRNEETGLLQKEHLLIACAEGALSADEQEELNTIVEQEPALLDELALYKKTKLPNETIVFSDKQRLKKKPAKLIYWQFYAATASVAAALLSLFLLNTPTIDPLYETARVTKYEQASLDAEQPNFGYILKSEVSQNSKPPSQEAPLSRIAAVESKAEKETSPKRIEEPLKQLDRQEGLASLDFEKKAEAKQTQIIELPEEELIAAIPEELNTEEPIEEKSQSLSLKEYAKETLKKEVLNNKTLTQVLADELANATNEKVVFEPASKSNKKGLQFAMNLGSISISKK